MLHATASWHADWAGVAVRRAGALIHLRVPIHMDHARPASSTTLTSEWIQEVMYD